MRFLLFPRRLPPAAFAALLLTAGCGTTPSAPSAYSSSAAGAYAPQTSAEGQPAPIVPDATLTPGAVLPVTKDDICVRGYAKKVRNVPEDVKKQAYAEYKITTHKKGEYEVDHLISLELGGSNSLKNLWPESYLTKPWNAHVKDQLENELHAEVCDGTISLAQAQHEIASDWIGSYEKHFRTDQPISGKQAQKITRRHRNPKMGGDDDDDVAPDAAAPSDSATPVVTPPDSASSASGPSGASPDTAGQVWVNTRSGKYFYPGARYYGKTKQGAYMSEQDAKAKGYTPAGQ